MSARRLTALLWAINLSAISASMFVYLYLAQHAYHALGSLLVSELVLVAPLVMPVLLAFQLNQVAARVGPRKLLFAANAAGACCCAVLFLATDLGTVSVLLGAAVVGALDALQRVARIVAIKRYFSAQDVRHTVPLTLTAQFVAGALAGAMLAFFPGRLTLAGAAIATTVLMGLAATCALRLPRPVPDAADAERTAASLAHAVALLRRTPALRDSLLGFVLLGACFQGFYNLSRVALPAHHLGLPGTFHLGVLQIIASLAAVSGALAYSALCRHQRAPGLAVVTPVCAIAMLAACELPGVAASFASYFVFFFCFELAFFRLQGDIVLATPPADMPLVATLQYALVYAGLMLTGGVGALLIGPIGLSGTALCLALGYFLGQALLRWLARRVATPASVRPTLPEP
ncbi:MAG TPA: MFS transporter [Hydrogenophaga sp.]|uniref:MFS transporter n=1 Tax=Hydrogenophaga sp. TaxID=1904254 RepID=UPI002D0B5115|nr:MFS transporter [Hydrogenophaga sp.]HSX92666.1 MFS transporter [Hydrogenophaga sp.]